MYKDISVLIQELNQKAKRITTQEITIRDEFKNAVQDSINESSDSIQFCTSFAYVTTGTGKHVFASNSWFYLAYLSIPLYKELVRYKEHIESSINLTRSQWTNFYSNAKNGNLDSTIFQAISSPLSSDEVEYFKKFLTDFSWWHGGKTIDRGDYTTSPILFALDVLAVSSDYIISITKIIANAEKLMSNRELNYFVLLERDSETSKVSEDEDISDYVDQTVSTAAVEKKSRQLVYFGAPGTGKSYQLNKDSEIFGKNIERVTFHPNMTYGNFVGVYKPFPINRPVRNSQGNVVIENDQMIFEEVITYKYVQGPLMKQIIKALMYPEVPVLLIIEELNRANVAAVFGDLFQLLDRDSEGKSQYPISINEDIRKYFEEIYIMNEGVSSVSRMKKRLSKGLIFPSNLFIWTTMNSADQGVMPMDAAFKRRWDFQYFGIDELIQNKDNALMFRQFQPIKVNERMGLVTEKWEVSWNDLRMKINDILSVNSNIPEDKLLGPFFISKNILDSDKVTEVFKSKVLMYLFDDVVKQNPSALFKNIDKMRYSNIVNAFEKEGLAIFGLKASELGRKSLDQISYIETSSTNRGKENEDS